MQGLQAAQEWMWKNKPAGFEPCSTAVNFLSFQWDWAKVPRGGLTSYNVEREVDIV